MATAYRAGTVGTVRLIDHHCHGVVRRDLPPDDFEGLLTEAGRARGGTLFDSRLGFALRRYCAPVLDLPADASIGDYLARRSELGHTEVTQRLLRAAELEAVLVDTGYTPEPLLPPAELATAAHARGFEVVRLEQVAQEVAPGVSAADFAAAVRAAIEKRPAVAAKSIAAYRVGLALAPDRPTGPEVRAAAGRWLSTGDIRLADPVLHRFLVWCAIDLGLPVQFHCGYGDRDVHLDRCNPLLLTDLLRATEPAGVPIVLLHNYPYHREAGYLAQVFSHVYFDTSLATHAVGDRAAALLAEALELAPFGKFLYASDGYGLPELHYLGAILFRSAAATALAGLPGEILDLIGAENARRLYRLDAVPQPLLTS